MRQLKALDLFSGLGGWSDGLAAEGFDVTGVEIEPKIAALYKHRVIVDDVCNLNPEEFYGYDLIVGSPPCKHFTRLPDHAIRDGKLWQWKKPKNPEEGLRLVHAFLNFVDVAKPRFWLMENVPGLQKYYSVEPRCKAHLSKSMVRCFYGNFPPFLIPTDLRKRKIRDIQGPLRSWERAKIPEAVSRELGKTVIAFSGECRGEMKK